MKDYKGKFDRFGIAVSFLCLVHCIILPVFITSLNVMGMEILHNPAWEALTLAGAIIAGTIAMRKGYRKHEQFWISLVFATGLFLMIISNLPGNHYFETIGKGLGVFIIISSHFINFRFSRCSSPVKTNYN